MEIKPYCRKVHYYETDQMGITHHSNYIRWFEEARVDLMTQMGFPYKRLEEEGIISPLLSVSCEYKSPVVFDEEVMIQGTIKKFNGIKMTVGYEIRGVGSGELKTRGESQHCFVNREGIPVSLKKENKEIYGLLLELAEG